MRIKDLSLMPYEIEAETSQFMLLKIGIVEGDGPNAGDIKEVTHGYFSKSPAGLDTLLKVVARDKAIEASQKADLQKYITAYKAELDRFSDRLFSKLAKALEKPISPVKENEGKTVSMPPDVAQHTN